MLSKKELQAIKALLEEDCSYNDKDMELNKLADIASEVPRLLAHIDHQQNALEWLAMRDMPLCDAAREFKDAMDLQRCLLCAGRKKCIYDHISKVFNASKEVLCQK